MEQHFDFTPLLVVTVLAVLVPVLLKQVSRLGIPIVVGEILAGMFVGSAGLGLVTDIDPWLDFLTQFGFAYLMFLSGLEIDFGLFFRRPSSKVQSVWKRTISNPFYGGMIFFSLTVLLAVLAALWLVRIGLARDAVVMGLIFATTSLGVVMPVLKERGLSFSDLGQHILVASSLGDFVTILLISTYVTLHTRGFTFDLLLVLVLLAATFLVYRISHISQRHLPLERLIKELSHATAQLDVRSALALAVVFIALAQGLGIELILGAFLAGAIISLLSEERGSDLRPKLNALGYGFFIPIFFIMVGIRFDLQALLATPNWTFLVPELILVAFAVKMIAALVYLPVFNGRQVLGIGALTSSRLSLIIAVAAIGVEIGAISEAMNSAIVVVALVSVTLSPLLFNLLVPRKVSKRGQVVIVGTPPHARLLAQRLENLHEEVVIVTGNRDFIEQASDTSVRIEAAPDKDYLQALDRIGSVGVAALVSMLDDEKMTLRVTSHARNLGISNVVAYVKNPELVERLKLEGIHGVEPGLSLVVALEAMIRHPQAFELLAEAREERDVVAVTVKNVTLQDKALKDVRFPGDSLVLVLDRDREIIVPRGYTRLKQGDVLTLIGSHADLELAADYLSSSS